MDEKGIVVTFTPASAVANECGCSSRDRDMTLIEASGIGSGPQKDIEQLHEILTEFVVYPLDRSAQKPYIVPYRSATI